MTPLPKMVNVHEKTVKRAQEHADKAKVYRIRTGHQHRTATHYVKVDSRVWETAMDLAGGDPTRITVVHATEVIVNNHSNRKAKP
jgi:hypothetical protein